MLLVSGFAGFLTLFKVGRIRKTQEDVVSVYEGRAMQPFFTWKGCDLLCLGLVNIGNKSTNLDKALPFTGNTELILVKQNL